MELINVTAMYPRTWENTWDLCTGGKITDELLFSGSDAECSEWLDNNKEKYVEVF